MQNTPNLLTRDDTFLGVCQGLGEDLRIPPNLLRIAISGLLFYSPPLAVAVYLALGIVVAATRFIAPDAKPSGQGAQVAGTATAGAPVEAEPVALAA
jgi:phage shock protein PspC (stress-responsive transcriptional regulator)